MDKKIITVERVKVNIESEELINFHSKERWLYHSTDILSKEKIIKQIDSGYFESNNSHSFWVENYKGNKIGLMRLFDLEDIGHGSPLFDIKIRSEFRGQGAGVMAVKWLSDHVFNTWKIQNRFEGTTRVDNIAMRKVFRKNGFVREGHYRQAWPGNDGKLYDAVQYTLLRSDWESGTITKINWDEI